MDGLFPQWAAGTELIGSDGRGTCSCTDNKATACVLLRLRQETGTESETWDVLAPATSALTSGTESGHALTTRYRQAFCAILMLVGACQDGTRQRESDGESWCCRMRES